MEVIGVDAWKKGWVVVRLADGLFREARTYRGLDEVVADAGGAVMAVDIPLGLLAEGWRECDLLVRGKLGRRSSSLFLMPPRAVVETPGYAEAGALCREMTGSGLTKQAHALFPKVREADRVRESGAHTLYEVHPELSFLTMAGAPLRWGKRSWNGQADRRRLLAGEGVALPDDLGAAGEVPVDDVLDAAAVAWTAHRIATGRAWCHPEPPQRDGSGGPIAIWC